MLDLKQLASDNKGNLPAFAWPGGYPLLYLDKHNEVLCSECATKDLFDPETATFNVPVTYDVYYEGPTVQCAECNKEIESAYGDPEQED